MRGAPNAPHTLSRRGLLGAGAQRTRSCFLRLGCWERMSIPKPAFVDCDETSLTVKFPEGGTAFPPPGKDVLLEYKEPPVPWEEAGSVPINASTGVIKEQDVQEIANLKPGTPYFVRLVLVDQTTGAREYGPETVLDTKPVDCGPKGKKKGCQIS